MFQLVGNLAHVLGPEPAHRIAFTRMRETLGILQVTHRLWPPPDYDEPTAIVVAAAERRRVNA